MVSGGGCHLQDKIQSILSVYWLYGEIVAGVVVDNSVNKMFVDTICSVL